VPHYSQPVPVSDDERHGHGAGKEGKLCEDVRPCSSTTLRRQEGEGLYTAEKTRRPLTAGSASTLSRRECACLCMYAID
jgi:hypothetical protein